VAAVAAVQVQPVRVGELGGVVVSRREHQGDEVAAADPGAVQIEVLARDADGPLDRAVVAEHLFDGRPDQGRVGAEPLPLIGVA
jgi:hypothetical protein